MLIRQRKSYRATITSAADEYAGSGRPDLSDNNVSGFRRSDATRFHGLVRGSIWRDLGRQVDVRSREISRCLRAAEHCVRSACYPPRQAPPHRAWGFLRHSAVTAAHRTEISFSDGSTLEVANYFRT